MVDVEVLRDRDGVEVGIWVGILGTWLEFWERG
jgi:hypothetical protein